jgi:hypothetical protein
LEEKLNEANPHNPENADSIQKASETQNFHRKQETQNTPNTLKNQNSQNTESINRSKRKVQYINLIFKDIEKAREVFSGLGIGTLSEWNQKFGEWRSATPYFQILGKTRDANFENNLALYLRSDYKDFIPDMKLVLNINKEDELKIAMGKFYSIGINILNIFDVKLPEEIDIKFRNGEEFNISTEDLTIDIKIINTNIRTIEFSIRVKDSVILNWIKG